MYGVARRRKAKPMASPAREDGFLPFFLPWGRGAGRTSIGPQRETCFAGRPAPGAERVAVEDPFGLAEAGRCAGPRWRQLG